MSQKDSPVDTEGLENGEGDAEELVAYLEAHEEEIEDLLELLTTTQAIAEDLAPELREAVHDNRSEMEELRMALEKEETVMLLRKLGDNTDTFIELIDILDASQGVVEDLVPELVVVARENRETVERLRLAFEKEETILLLERLGENVDVLLEHVKLLEVTKDLADDLVPEVNEVVRENREPLADLRMAAAGFADAQAEQDIDMYQLGQGMANVMSISQTLGDPEVSARLEGALDALAEEDPEPVGPLGLLGALFDSDVRRALGRLLEAARRLGR